MDGCSSKSVRVCINEGRDFRLAMGPGFVLLVSLLAILLSQVQSAGLPIQNMLMSKRLADPHSSEDIDQLAEDVAGVKYDEYPVVVPKRAALIIDRILKEIEATKDNARIENDWGSQITRRGNKEKIYFRCYFNAVSCYKRK